MTRSARWSLALVWLVACGGDLAEPPAGSAGVTGSGASPPGGAAGSIGSTGGVAGSTSGSGGSVTAGGATGGQAGSTTTTAGGTGGAAGTVSTPGELPCDLDALLVSRCQQCHSASPKYGAPMPLVTRADLLAPSFSDPSVTTAVRSLARMGDAKKPMPQPPNPRATDAEQALLADWISAGYPAATGSCAGGAAGTAGSSGTSGQSGSAGSSAAGATTAGTGGTTAAGGSGPTAGGTGGGGGSAGSYGGSGQSGDAGSGGAGTVCPDVTVAPGQPWTMPKDTVDQYVCYGFDVPAAVARRQLIQIAPHVDNPTIVHHLLLLTAPSSQPTAPTPCAALPPLDWRLLYGWAPGGGVLDLPSAAGYPIQEGETMHLVMQVHYSNLKQLSGQQDKSGVSLCSTTELRPYDADMMAFGSLGFSLPPHQATKLQCTSSSPASQPLTLFQAWPHMHTLGTAFDGRVRRADSTETMLASDGAFSFYNQLTYPLATTLQPGDQVLTTCTWDNPTNDVVTFGEATSQEMCFNFVSYYPRIEGSFNWLQPSATASCKKVK